MLKVLSVRQPYASLIISGEKRFEARTWLTQHRGALLIHASSAKPTRSVVDEFRTRRALFNCAESLGWHTEESIRDLPRSAIIGRVTLQQCYSQEEFDGLAITDLDEDACGGLNGVCLWEFSDPLAIAPVKCSGKLNVWALPPQLAAVIEKRLASPAAPPLSCPGVDGTALKLELWLAEGRLRSLIGPNPMTIHEAFRTFFNLEEVTVAGGQTPMLRLNQETAFLAPGMTELSLPEAGQILRRHLIRQ